MAVVAAVWSPVITLSPSLHTHSRNYRIDLSTKLPSVKRSHHNQPLHRKTVNARHSEGDFDTEKYHGDERASCDCSRKPGESEHVKKEQHMKKEQYEAKGKSAPSWGGFHYFSKLGFSKAARTSAATQARDKHQDLQHHHDSWTQQLQCRLRCWWQIATRPQNLLAAFLAGLLLYAFALFGWQVMVVAVDVTLLVLKCSFAAVVLFFMYIFLI